MPDPLFVVFITVLLTLVGGGHFYLARRLIFDPGMPEPWSGLLTGLLVGLGVLMVSQPFAERLLPRHVARLVSWPAFLWAGAGFILVSLLAVSDVLLFAVGWLTPALAGTPGAPEALPAVQALVVAGLGLVASVVGTWSGLRLPRLKPVEVRLAGWPRALDGYRIVQLSDIHIGPLLDRRFARALVEMANGAAPDAVVITGDAVDGTVARIGAEVEPFADLKARDGVYYVTGNHEHYYHPGEWCAAFERLGLTVLRNSGRRIGSGEASFYLAGVYDHRGDMGGGYREDLPAALAGRDPRWPVVLLAHDPATFAQAARLGVGLQLAGHTHGGQIWPFNYLVRLTTRYLHGLHRLDRSWLYVSRGSGFWGPPMRLFAPHEVTVLTLRPE